MKKIIVQLHTYCILSGLKDRGADIGGRGEEGGGGGQPPAVVEEDGHIHCLKL